MSTIKPTQDLQPSVKATRGPRLKLRNREKSGTSFWARLWAQRELWIMLLPVFVFYALFRYAPIYGLRISFLDYNAYLGYDGSPWIGLGHFERLFGLDKFWALFRNTLTLGGLCFFLGTPATILFALILNEIRQARTKKIYQTISYLPTFLSTVIICSIFIELFSIRDGIINMVIQKMGGDAVDFLQDKNWYHFIYVLSDFWAGLGNGAIIYLSALAGVDAEMYEAAEIDGCSRLKRIWYITLPSIIPTIVTMFLLGIGSIVRIGADKALLLTNPGNRDVAEIFSTYIVNLGVWGNQFDLTAAVGFFESVMAACLLFLFNYLAKKGTGESIW